MKRFLLAAALALLATGGASAGTLLCNNGGLAGTQDCTVGSGLSLSAGGVLSSTVTGTTPGGSSGQLQINNSGSFGGITLGGDCTFSSPNVTCTKTGGSVFAASATTDTTSATNISSGTLGSARLPVAAITSGTIAGLTGLGIRDTSAAFDLTTAAVSSTALTAGRTLTFDVVNGSRTVKLASGLTIVTDPGTVTGAVKANGSGTFGQAACGDLSNGATGCSTATGTSGATIPLLNGANTWSGVQSINSGDLALKGASTGTITLNAASAAGSNTLTLPAGTTDLSATGGTSQVVKQTSSGGALTVARLACSDLSDSGAGCTGGASTSAFTLISTQTAASATPIAWTGLDSSASGVNTLKLECNGLVLASTGNGIWLRFGTGATPTYQTTSYYYNLIYQDSSATTVSGLQAENTSVIGLTTNPQWATGTGSGINISATIDNFGSASLYKTVRGEWSFWGSNSHSYSGRTGGTWNSTTAVTAIELITANSDNFNSGQCSLYKLTP